ncbi:MAG: 16S rRNA (uracil(1498)-N(3))-methyltransferase [Nitrospinae bacterium]|nr:16S rRNA (uracil(1498)-N(3))-methyltransferase [Nitrospinota bacterium]
MRHFIVSPLAVSGDSVTITGQDAHHIHHVLRLKKGDEITVAAGEPGRLLCEVAHISKESVTATIIARLAELEPAGPKIILAQGLPKGKKMDDIVRMACELGVAEIIPVVTQRCVAKIGDNADSKVERWNAVSIAAAKQSQASHVTAVAGAMQIGALPSPSGSNISIVLWEEESRPLKEILQTAPKPDSITIVIGPEGGLAKDEVESLKSRGFSCASIGNKILRTETAGVAAASMILYHYS